MNIWLLFHSYHRNAARWSIDIDRHHRRISDVAEMELWLLEKRGIPYVEPTIIFGNMKEVITGSTNIGVVSQKIYK